MRIYRSNKIFIGLMIFINLFPKYVTLTVEFFLTSQIINRQEFAK